MTWPVLAATHFGPLGPLGVNLQKIKSLMPITRCPYALHSFPFEVLVTAEVSGLLKG
jgi:hypothetical protein